MPARTDPDITVRPLVEGDFDALREMHRRHSPETIYRRFFGCLPELPEKMARAFVSVDGAVCAALTAELPTGELIGVARYHRDAADETKADFAIVVTDDWQDHGLGHRLLLELIAVARANGVTHFTDDRLATNTGVRDLMAHCGMILVKCCREDECVNECWELPAA